jgi:hypothetical protein
VNILVHYYTNFPDTEEKFKFNVFYLDILLSTSAVIEELSATGKFEFMDLSVDEAEHSMEMHLPYLSKVFQG